MYPKVGLESYVIASSGFNLLEIVLIPNGPYNPDGVFINSEPPRLRVKMYGVLAFKGFPSDGISRYRCLSST